VEWSKLFHSVTVESSSTNIAWLRRFQKLKYLHLLSITIILFYCNYNYCLTRVFDLMSRDGLFKVLAKIGCPPKLLSLIQSFHMGMKGITQFNGSSSEAFSISGGVKQGCVLAPTLFGIYFAVMLKQAFGSSTEGIYLRTRSDGKLFSLSRLRAKTKVREVLIRDMLFTMTPP